MSRLTEKQLLFLTIGIAVLLAGGLGFLIWSDLQTIDEEEEKIENLKTQIAAANREIDLIPQREFQVIADREKAEREVAFLPEAEEIESFWEVLETFARESGVRISEIAATAQRAGRGRKGQKQGPIASVPQVMRLRATADEFLRFINLIENYDRIINVIEYSIGAGSDGTADPDGKVRHSISLALTTFTYNRRIADTIVSIPKYEEKKKSAEVKKFLSQIKIQDKEKYTLSSSMGRRDPFVSIRRARVATPEANDAGDLDQQMLIVDQLVELVRALAEGLVFEKTLRERNDLWRLQAQRKENKEFAQQLSFGVKNARKDISHPKANERFQKEVFQPWEELVKKMDEITAADPPLPLEHVRERLKKVQALFDERKWVEVQEEARGFLDESRKGEHVVEEAKDLVQKLLDLQRSSRVIQAFEKRKIVISTILFSPKAPANSVAVINGKQLGEGDALDAAGEVILLSIGRNFVIFLVEDVEIKLTQK